MQDEFNNSQPESNGVNPPNTGSQESVNSPDQQAIPIENRVIQPLNPNITPDPIASKADAPVPDVNGNIVQQQAIVNAPEVNPLSQGAGLVPKKSNKKLIILIASLLAVLLLGGGAYAAYSWYQNPQKVVTDSLVNGLTVKQVTYTGNVSLDSDGTKMTIDIKGKSANLSSSAVDASITISNSGKDFKTDGSVIYGSNGDMFVKVDGLKEIADEYLSSMGIDDSSTYADFNSAVDKFIKKVDGTWIKISASDLKEFGQSYSKSQTCVNNAIKKFESDKTAVSEVADVYSKNQFIVVDKELGQKDGNLGYQIKSDNAKLKSFANGLKDTVIYKTLHDCDSSYTINADDIDTATTSSSDSTVKLWVQTWSHKIAKLDVSAKESEGKSNGSATINFDYNSKVEVTNPSDSISISELKSSVEELMTSLGYGSDSNY